MDDRRTFAAVDHADLERATGSVPTNEHREAFIDVIDEYRVVECVDHLGVGDAVFAGTGSDERLVLWPRRAMGSFVDAPVQAARVAPAWRRSCSVMWVMPVVSRALVQDR